MTITKGNLEYELIPQVSREEESNIIKKLNTKRVRLEAVVIQSYHAKVSSEYPDEMSGFGYFTFYNKNTKKTDYQCLAERDIPHDIFIRYSFNQSFNTEATLIDGAYLMVKNGTRRV
jgi:hypothetical protein